MFVRQWKNIVDLDKDTDDNMAHAHYILDTEDCKHKLRMCNNYCFSTENMFTRERLNISLCVHCLSCSIRMEMETA